MAANWIPIRPDLWGADKVEGIADLTGLAVDTVVGKLVRVWGWFDSETTNGAFLHAQACALDKHADHPGFAAAMLKVGWLTVENGAVIMPDFDAWHTEPAKTRMKNAKRMRRGRTRNVLETVHKTRTTGQDRTEQNIPPPTPPLGDEVESSDVSELETALAEALGAPATDPEKRRRAKTLAQLQQLEATPADVATRVARHRRNWPDRTVTDASLLRHWTACGRGREKRPGDL